MFTGTTLSFFAFLALFVAIGVYSAKRKKDTPEDYLLASREVNPWLVALSAVATQNSGFMFIGLTGTAYASGLFDAAWFGIGWVTGDWISWLFVHRRLRERSGARLSRTIPEFLGGGLVGGRAVVVLAAVITMVFLSLYASAQLTAGRKALDTFGIDTWIGVILGAAIVVAYCFSGGIRASIWTDAAQSIVMFVSMWLLVIVGVSSVGGLDALWSQLEAIDPALISWTRDKPMYMVVFFVLGWGFGGFGVVGQPHVMIRLMALDSPRNTTKAQVMYIAWFAIFSAACVMVGLLARVYLHVDAGFDAEYALPRLADGLLPGALVGLMLAGVFAATISTADSQVLSCSAAITQDLSPGWSRSYSAVKMGTLGVAGFAATIALLADSFPDSIGQVFSLVTFAWSGLAASLGPLLIVRALGQPISAVTALVMMLTGLAAVFVWNLALGDGDVLDSGLYIYATLPGMVVGLVVYAIARVAGAPDGREKKTP